MSKNIQLYPRISIKMLVYDKSSFGGGNKKGVKLYGVVNAQSLELELWAGDEASQQRTWQSGHLSMQSFLASTYPSKYNIYIWILNSAHAMNIIIAQYASLLPRVSRLNPSGADIAPKPTVGLSPGLKACHRPILGFFMNRLPCSWGVSSTLTLIRPSSKNTLPFRPFEHTGSTDPPSQRKPSPKSTGLL